MVGLGAAVGLNPDVKGRVTETWTEAKAVVQETVQSAFDAVAGANVNVGASLDVSAEGKADASTGANVQAGTEGSAALDLNGFLDESASLDGSLSAESQTSAETQGFGLSLKNMINSALGIGLGFGE
jgi:hypothetical protein